MSWITLTHSTTCLIMDASFISHAVQSRCKKSKELLEHSESDPKYGSPDVCVKDLTDICRAYGRMKLGLDPSKEQAGKDVRALLDGYNTETVEERSLATSVFGVDEASHTCCCYLDFKENVRA